MIPLKTHRSLLACLGGLLLLPVGLVILLIVFAEPDFEFRIGDILAGNTRLRFRDLDLSAEPRLSPVHYLIGDGRVCDAMIVKGSYDHYMAAAVRTPDHCQYLMDTLTENQIDYTESDAERNQDFGLDTRCGREISDSGAIFAGTFNINRDDYAVKGRFDETSGWVFLLIRRPQ